MPDSELSPATDRSAFTVRYDPIHGWPVMYAPPRALRPFDFKARKTLVCPADDPFLEGREEITTAETLAIRPAGTPANGPGWQVRIIPNKYPALAPLAADGPALVTETDASCQGLHEVIIECPQAETHFTRLPTPHRLLIFQAIRDRLRQLAIRNDLVHATLFKNHGPAAGASLTHSHCQLLATQFVPPHIQRELNYCEQLSLEQGVDYFEQLITTELAAEQRVVEVTEEFVLCCPNVSRFGFEMHVWPRRPALHFHTTSDAVLSELNGIFSRALQRLERVAADPDYNLVLHTAPFKTQAAPGFRWHWEIYPRIAGIAGWELGGGGYVNPLYPETAADMLRQVNLTDGPSFGSK